jgi:hypothetical protein
MTIAELIKACERRLSNLHSVRGSALALGDMVQVDRIDAQIEETQDTLNKLRTVA